MPVALLVLVLSLLLSLLLVLLLRLLLVLSAGWDVKRYNAAAEDRRRAGTAA
jgi:hypothetical protein